jgi:hypothetical protein
LISKRIESGRQQLLFAASLANLYMMPTWSVLLPYAVGMDTHALAKPRREDYIAAVLVYMVLAAIMLVAVRALATITKPAVRWGAALLIALGLAVPVNLLRTLGGTFSVGVIVANTPAVAVVLALAAGIGLIVARAHLLRAAIVLVFLLSPLAAMTLAEAVWGIATVPASVEPARKAARPAPSGSEPAARVLVVVFDEWDLGATFLNRPADVQLPEIDRFRQAALHATAAYSPAGSTLLSVSAILSGKRVTDVIGRPDGGVDLAFDDQVLAFERAGVLLERLHQEGVRSGLVGWSVPYCHTFAPVLEQCRQLDHGIVFRKASPMITRMGRQLRHVLPWSGKESFLDMVKEGVAVSEQMAADRALDFVWVHLPGPHLPVFYDRATRDYTLLKFNEVNGYFDNLTWVDDTLGRLRASMEKAGTWDQTSVILTSDHSWRLSKIADGTRDPRVPMLVKLARRHEALTHDRSFNTMAIADVVEQLLQNSSASYVDVIRWLNESAVAAVAPVPSS